MAVTNTTPVLTAAPLIGGETLHVNFLPLIPATYMASLGTNITSRWDFGDGVRLTNAGPSVAPVDHDYAAPGYYTATLGIAGKNATTNMVTPLITVLRQGSPVGTMPVQITAVSFIGSLASPGPGAGADIVPTLKGTANGVPFATLYQESQRDVAAFDIDRYPFAATGAAFSPTREDTDFFVQTGTPWFASPTLWDSYYDAAQGDGAYKVYPRPDRPPPVKPSRFRVVCTLGGAVFAEQPSRVGIYSLQAGRLEP